MSKIVSILGVCAAIAGVSAYAMYGNSDSHRGCDGCRVGHVNASSVEPACGVPHDSAADEGCEKSCCASKAVAKVATPKADCCAATAACCPGACCDDAASAVAGTMLIAAKVSAKAKKSCCSATAACCPGACCDDAISAITGTAATVTKTSKSAK